MPNYSTGHECLKKNCPYEQFLYLVLTLIRQGSAYLCLARWDADSKIRSLAQSGGTQNKEKEVPDFQSDTSFFVLGTGIEPVRTLLPTGF